MATPSEKPSEKPGENLVANDEYWEAIKKGKALYTEQQSFGRDRVSVPLADSYDIDDGILRSNAHRGLEKKLAPIGLSVTRVHDVEAESRVRCPDGPAYLNWFDAENGIMVCSENYKHRDKNPTPLQLSPSEVLWQSWGVAVKAQRQSISNLAAILRFHVINEKSKRLIWSQKQ